LIAPTGGTLFADLLGARNSAHDEQPTWTDAPVPGDQEGEVEAEPASGDEGPGDEPPLLTEDDAQTDQWVEGGVLGPTDATIVLTPFDEPAPPVREWVDVAAGPSTPEEREDERG
jgi:hypothetical protein